MSLLKQIGIETSAIKRTKKDIKRFGLLVGFIFIVFGFWFQGVISLVLIISGSLLVVLSILATRVLLYPYLAWMTLVVFVGFFMFRILLVAIYLCVIIPTGLVMHLIKFKRLSKEKKTYWIEMSDK